MSNVLTGASFVDVNNITWHDARLREPEHYTAERDGFVLDVLQVARGPDVATPTGELWEWRVDRAVKQYVAEPKTRDEIRSMASGSAESKGDAEQLTYDAIALLKRGAKR